MTRRELLTTAALAAAATVLGGCADPYADAPTTTQVQGKQLPQHAAHDEAVEGPDQRLLAATAVDAVRRAALLTGNWTTTNVARQQRELAAISVGQAHRDALQAAARLPTDPQLHEGQTSSRSTVAAISLHGAGARRSGLIVTHERLSIDGVMQERWRVTLVTIVRIEDDWAISRFEPQE